MVMATPPGAFFLDFVAGGFTDGVADDTVLVGMSNAHLYVRNSATKGDMVTRSLPVAFALPVTLDYNATDGSRILGPVSHGRTTSLALSAADSNRVSVTGWQSVANNEGAEQVFSSSDGGVTWSDVTGNMRNASGVEGKVRPGGLLIVDLKENKDRALLVSTANGVLVSFDSAPARWTRLGTCNEFPIVRTSSLSYEHYSDTLAAATMGRGIFSLHGAKAALLQTRERLTGAPSVPESSSAEFFPPQQQP